MTAPDPAALLAAMEAAAREYHDAVSQFRIHGTEPNYDRCIRAKDAYSEIMQAPNVLQLCAALRASQEREAAAVAAEREACVALVEAEPELPGDPPEILAEDIAKHPVEYMRVAVKATKRGIIAAIRARKDAAP